VSEKPFAAAAAQNQQAILSVLGAELSAGDHVLELGSGTGQHVCFFAQHLPEVFWQPTELPSRLDGIRMWLADFDGDNVLPPLSLDVRDEVWPTLQAQVIYSANTFHIVSWQAIESVFAGCSSSLTGSGKLCVYGPFKIDGRFTTQSNAQFDQMLRAQDPLSGVRDSAELNALALSHGFRPARMIPMPANNFVAIWQLA